VGVPGRRGPRARWGSRSCCSSAQTPMPAHGPANPAAVLEPGVMLAGRLVCVVPLVANLYVPDVRPALTAVARPPLPVARATVGAVLALNTIATHTKLPAARLVEVMVVVFRPVLVMTEPTSVGASRVPGALERPTQFWPVVGRSEERRVGKGCM